MPQPPWDQATRFQIIFIFYPADCKSNLFLFKKKQKTKAGIYRIHARKQCLVKFLPYCPLAPKKKLKKDTAVKKKKKRHIFRCDLVLTAKNVVNKAWCHLHAPGKRCAAQQVNMLWQWSEGCWLGSPGELSESAFGSLNCMWLWIKKKKWASKNHPWMFLFFFLKKLFHRFP